ncbi:ankyrin repeat-containing domain protein [Aspergillus pseudoustus]|uniref:Ankyrin repeat-containing domain protein n=1 Tax=Aspergillus pseudoustus TaxID=1810923 RepID=A0ABR4KQF9_9EURO
MPLHFLDLPPEILLIILSYLTEERGLSSLAQTTKHLHAFANPYLYANNARYHGSTALLWAAAQFSDRELTARASLRNGANVNATDLNGRTPLLWAAWNGNLNLVRLLLSTGGADVNARDAGGATPLSVAAQSGYTAIAKVLLETEGINVNAADTIYARAPLSMAAEGGHVEIVRLLLETGKVDLDTNNWRVQASFFWAAERGFEGVVRLLLATGKVDFNATFTSQGASALCQAARNGRAGVVKMFLDFSARSGVGVDEVNLDVRDESWGRTPLAWAVAGGHVDVMEVLLATGRVDLDARDASGQSALALAAEYGHTAAARMLLEAAEKGNGVIDVNAAGEQGWTPLLLAASGGWHGVVQQLLQTGSVNLEARDTVRDRTPLSWAAANGHVEVVEMLLKTGRVDVNAKDLKYQRTPLLWAQDRGYDAVVELLEELEEPEELEDYT